MTYKGATWHYTGSSFILVQAVMKIDHIGFHATTGSLHTNLPDNHEHNISTLLAVTLAVVTSRCDCIVMKQMVICKLVSLPIQLLRRSYPTLGCSWAISQGTM